jgi:hypothetical protein
VIGDILHIYYGAADTVAGCARVNLTDLLSTIHPATADKHRFKRMVGDPLIEPNPRHPWEAKATLTRRLSIGSETYAFVSIKVKIMFQRWVCCACSDGISIKEKWPEPIYVPREDLKTKSPRW